MQLTFWKIQAIKACILLERRGRLLRSDFKHLNIDARRWIQEWLEPTPDRNGFVAGKYFPNFKGQHPRNYDEIAADFDKWAPVPTIEKPAQLRLTA